MAEYDVVLLPGYAQVEAWRKQHAENLPSGLFSQTVTTFDDWIRDLWELHGDGRAIADAAQRQIAMQLAFGLNGEDAPEGVLEDVFEDESDGVSEGRFEYGSADVYEDGFEADLETDGSPSIGEHSVGEALLAARCVKRAAGVHAFEAALSSVQGLGDRADAPGVQRQGNCANTSSVLGQGGTVDAAGLQACDNLADAAGLQGRDNLACAAGLQGRGGPVDTANVQGQSSLVDVSSEERDFLCCMARYRDAVAERGLVELGEAARLLASANARVFPRPLSVLVCEAAPLTWVQSQFFADCPQLNVQIEYAPGQNGISRAPDATTVRFGFPSGRLAQPGLVTDILRAHLAEMPAASPRQAVVACKNPLALFEKVAPVIAGRDTCVQVQYKRAFARTDFGRAFLALYHAVHDNIWNPRFVQDVIATPFAGLSRADAIAVDTMIRQDRIVARDDLLSWLRVRSELFSQLEEVVSDPEADILLGVFESEALARLQANPVWCAEQLSALSALRSVTQAARMLGAGMPLCVSTLDRVSINVSAQMGGAEEAARTSAPAGESPRAEGDDRTDAPAGESPRAINNGCTDAPANESPHAESSARTSASAHASPHAKSKSPGAGLVSTITFMSQPMAAQLSRASCSLVVAADLTAADYPLSSKDDAGTTLLAKLGLIDVDSPLSRARRAFQSLVNVASDTLFLVRPLADDDAAETYPSTVLEEFVDAYRSNPSATEDIDNLYRLPAFLQEGLEQRGEEFLFANAVAQPRAAKQKASAHVPWPHISDVPSDGPHDFTPRRKNSKGELLELACPSPSQVEVYLECPYRWYASRSLKAAAVDEGFGPLERGSFAHEALETFYRRFMEAGNRKVNSENIEQARSLMAETVEQLAVDQFQRNPGSGRYVPATELEAREVASLARQLMGYLDFESQLLPTFSPAYLEYEITADNPVSYGGGLLVGKVDRIDVDQAGNAVIIDYKGSVNAAYNIEGKTLCVPGKVQTLMYAQAIKRQLGLNVVGAFYVSYGSSPALAGACDARAIESAHLPQVKAGKCSCGAMEGLPQVVEDDFALSQLTFASLLDTVEDIASRAMQGMAAGEVPACPTAQGACTYCPVETCPNRGV